MVIISEMLVMAMDAGITEDQFQELWRATEKDRTIGKLWLEEAVEMILRKNKCYSGELLNLIVKKRIQSKEEVFHHLHKDNRRSPPSQR